jgi:hypothetical protein
LIRKQLVTLQTGEHDSFVTFQVPGDVARWIQIGLLDFNAAYPFSDPPEIRLAMFDAIEITEWQANSFVLGEIGMDSPDRFAGLVDRYFREILGCQDDYQLDSKMNL